MNLIDESREFDISEMFMSLTDRRGVIENGNSVFARVSGYELSEMIGKPHNMIRHPDTPRAVFKLLWDYLLSGRPVAAYVKNRASDGRYYWVLALARPAKSGFISVRLKPSSPTFEKVKEIYSEMIRIEKTQGDRGDERKAGMEASTEFLVKTLRDHGHSYDSFIGQCLIDELTLRSRALSGRVMKYQTSLDQLISKKEDAYSEYYKLGKFASDCKDIFNNLVNLFSRLSYFQSLQKQTDESIEKTKSLTEGFSLTGLNMVIQCNKMGDSGKGLGVIAHQLGVSSVSISNAMSNLEKSSDSATDLIGMGVLNISSSLLYAEMVNQYLAEMFDAKTLSQQEVSLVETLYDAFSVSAKAGIEAFTKLAPILDEFDSQLERLHRLMLTLDFAQVRGLVESARMADRDKVDHMLSGIRDVAPEAKVYIEKLANKLLMANEQMKVVPMLAFNTGLYAKRALSNINDIRESLGDS